MNANMYQEAALRTAVYPREVHTLYPAIGLVNESGELLGKVKKTLRGDVDFYPKEAIIDELGDVLWYAAVLANDLGVTLGSVLQRNLDKLEDRAKRGVIKGNGDNR